RTRVRFPPPPYSNRRQLMAFVAMLSYGRSRAARVHLEANIVRTRARRSDLRRSVMDRGGRDPLVDRVPDLAIGRARPRTTRRAFRDRLARVERAFVSARPS